MSTYEQQQNKNRDAAIEKESASGMPKNLAQVRREMRMGAVSKTQPKEGGIDLKQKAIQERFERLLRGKFQRIPAGNFKTRNEHLQSISFVRSRPSENGLQTLYAMIYYRTPRGAEGHATWTVSPNGIMRGDRPKDFPVTNLDVQNEILNTIERIGLDFWHKTNIEILPLPDPDEPKEITIREDENEKREKQRIDLERIEFLENHPDALFGIINTSRGFNAYHAFLFPGFVLIDHPVIENAAYLVPLPEAPTIDMATVRQWNDAKREAYVDRYIKPIFTLAQTKKTLREYGGIQIIHTPDRWKEKIAREINVFLHRKEK